MLGSNMAPQVELTCSAGARTIWPWRPDVTKDKKRRCLQYRASCRQKLPEQIYKHVYR